MENLVVNLIGKVRRVTEGNTEYLVAPMVLINPGVLNGSRGPLLYRPEDVAESADSWDRIPIVVYHPTDPLTGAHNSARDEGVLDRQGVGELRNPVFDGKLRAEGWFNLQRTRAVDPRVYRALTRGERLELSTGLYTENVPAPSGASHRGRPYTHVARGYLPDHLAVLPDQVGACSLADGCGVLVNAKGDDGGWLEVAPANGWCEIVLPTENALVVNALPSTGLDMTADKACKVLEDGYVHGKPLTSRQKGMFGALCGKRKKKGKKKTKNAAAWQDFSTANAFCPTGKGGGKDPSCGSSGGSSRYGQASRAGTPTAMPESGQWSPEATVKKAAASPRPKVKVKGKGKKVVEDDPEASRVADRLHEEHLKRVKDVTDPLDFSQSYGRYEQELEEAGVVPTLTGYGFKGKGKAARNAAAWQDFAPAGAF